MMRFVAVFLLGFLVYIVFTGSASLYTIATGLIVAAIVSAICSRYLVRDERKLSIARLAHLTAFIFRFVGAEIRAHIDVTKRILSDIRTAINPGIVKIPYEARSDYAITMIANSITNTPGTAVVEIDPTERCFYIHWLYVKTYKRDEMRQEVVSFYEDYARRVFD